MLEKPLPLPYNRIIPPPPYSWAKYINIIQNYAILHLVFTKQRTYIAKLVFIWAKTNKISMSLQWLRWYCSVVVWFCSILRILFIKGVRLSVILLLVNDPLLFVNNPFVCHQSSYLFEFIHFFIDFIYFSHNIKFTPFTTKYKNKMMIIIVIIIIIIIIITTTICVRTYIIDDSNKIFLAQI